MRRINYRGWDSVGSKGWVYGDLAHTKGLDHTKEDFLYDRTMVGGYEVADASVGQFTGLTDKNGNDIYEGDLVVTPYVDPIFGDLVEGQNGEGVTSEVVFHDGAFVVKYDEEKFIYLDAFTRKKCVEVVGTKYEKEKKDYG